MVQAATGIHEAGVYADDQTRLGRNGTFTYVGEGMNDLKYSNLQFADQKLVRGNLALLKAEQQGSLVRPWGLHAWVRGHMGHSWLRGEGCAARFWYGCLET